MNEMLQHEISNIKIEINENYGTYVMVTIQPPGQSIGKERVWYTVQPKINAKQKFYPTHV